MHQGFSAYFPPKKVSFWAWRYFAADLPALRVFDPAILPTPATLQPLHGPVDALGYLWVVRLIHRLRGAVIESHLNLANGYI